jgi:hypothetical protein
LVDNIHNNFIFSASPGLARRCRITAICPIERKSFYVSQRYCALEFKPETVTAIAKFEGDPRASNSSGESTGFFPGAAEILQE